MREHNNFYIIFVGKKLTEKVIKVIKKLYICNLYSVTCASLEKVLHYTKKN